MAKHPGHTWPVDLTIMPTRAGFWAPWVPVSLPRSWPFCWWISVAIDQMSRAVVGTTVFFKQPSSIEIQTAVDRAIRAAGTPPRYVVTGKGRQFWCRSYKRRCKHRGIRPRFGAIRQPASIALIERFIRSMKQEPLRRALVPISLAAMRREVSLCADRYNEHRPHMALAGKSPNEVLEGQQRTRRRFEPRPSWPRRPRHRPGRAGRLRLAVNYVEGRRHLPIIELKSAA